MAYLFSLYEYINFIWTDIMSKSLNGFSFYNKNLYFGFYSDSNSEKEERAKKHRVNVFWPDFVG